jgi:RimJ/RimL family protein N-acetyltransferase
MKSQCTLAGKKDSNLLLVPYEEIHVETYHKWMKDSFLLEMTGSEPLSLEEEYEMQKTWATDPNKYTFIITQTKMDKNFGMIGDVNLYILEVGEAEIEIMIAENEFRGRGIGRECVDMMMSYGKEALGIHTFIAKILEKNFPSIRLFESIGYINIGYSQVFKQHTFIKKLN